MKSKYFTKHELAALPCIHDGVDFRMLLQADSTWGKSVAIKLPQTDTLTPELAEKIAREYRLTTDLQLPCVRSALAQLTIEGRPALALEYIEGKTLDELLAGTPHSLVGRLELAIEISTALEAMHRQGLMHRNLAASHILISSTRKQVVFIGFGGASRTNNKAAPPKIADNHSTVLAYMSPEQSGRIGRRVDSRTDIYSLGVLLYEMFTGKLPFESKDPTELIHCHLAVKPKPLSEANTMIPDTVSRIVLRMMAKDPGDRYQSAYGIQADLTNCLNQLRETGVIEDFELGQFDYSDVFRPPKQLYGRDEELRALRDAVLSASRGQGEALLVSGLAGVGKSALMEELGHFATRFGASFVKGEYDGSQRHLPYAGLIQAINESIDMILTGSAKELAQWKQDLQLAVDQYASLLIDMVPRLELIIGPQPPAPETGPTEAQLMFQYLLKDLIFALAQHKRPLVLFLDNLQWADPASLHLLPLLLSDIQTQSFVLVGAYRQDEVGSEHPLAALADDDSELRRIELNNFTQDAVGQLITDALRVESTEAGPLAQQVVEKTGGNPQAVLQFMRTLQEEGHLRFDKDFHRWTWDSAAIGQSEISGSVAAMMAEKFSGLPEECRSLLSVSACIGNQFDINTLSQVVRAPITQISGKLELAVDAGLIRYVSSSTTAESALDDKTRFVFSHDRVRQTAYESLSRKERRLTHLKIGKQFLSQTPEHLIKENAFEIADQLNECFQYLTQEDERNQLVTLNLIAGRKARRSAAYQAAIRYLSMGVGLLPEDRWESCRELALNLYMESVEAEYLSTNFERAELLSQEAMENAGEPVVRNRLYEFQILLFSAQGQNAEAVQSGLNALTELGLALPASTQDSDAYPNKELQQLSALLDNIEALADLPNLTDARLLAGMRILMQMTVPAERTDAALLRSIVSHMVMLSVKHGNSPMAAIAYAWHAALLCCSADSIDAGYRFGWLSLAVLRNNGSQEVESPVTFLFNARVRHWKEHLRESLVPLEQVFRHSVDSDNSEYICKGAIHHCIHLFISGASLQMLSRKQDKYLDAIERSRLLFHAQVARVWGQAVANLRSDSGDPTRLNGTLFDESRLPLDWMKTSDAYLVFCVLCSRMMLRYLFDDFTGAAADGRLLERRLYEVRGDSLQPIHSFYYALALLAQHATADASEGAECLHLAQQQIDQMRRWTALAPMNFSHKLALLEAEQARIAGSTGEALASFNEATQLAKENGYIQDEALAFEREALFYDSLGRGDFASLSRSKAVDAYRSWGARRKVKELSIRFRQLPGPESPRLDTAAILKASHMLSQEIHLDQLLERLMHIVIESAGAEKGVLIQKSEAGFVIQAQTVLGSAQVETMQSVPVETCDEVAHSIVNYVARTLEPIVLSNACQDPNFSADNYILGHRIHSLLCQPIIYQGKLSGLLYLENNLATDVFTAERLELLKALASQAAISMENAHLYAELESNLSALMESEQKFRIIFNQAFQFIGVLSPEGVLLQANQTSLSFAGIEETQVIGKLFWETAWWSHSPELQLRLREGIIEAASGKLVRFEATHTRPDGETSYIDFSIKPVVNQEGRVIQLIPEGRDITERKLAEMSLQRLNRELRAISDCNQVLVRAVDEQELLDEICRIICEEAGYRLAGVGYAENDEAKTIRLAAWAGVDEDYLEQVQLSWGDTKHGHGPSGTAIRSGKIVYINDISNDPDTIPWRNNAIELGFRSSIALPLKNENDRVLGVLSIYSTEVNAFPEEERRLLKELADDLAYGIVTLRTRAEHNRSEEQMRIAATAFEAQEGIAVTDASEKILRVNRAFTDITGYTADEAMGSTPRLLKSDRHDKAYFESMWNSIRREGAWQGEIFNRHKSGSIYPAWLNITAVENAQGEVTHYVSTMTDITERKASERKIEHLAFYDLLTDLPNRQLLMDRLYQATMSCSRSHHTGGLLFIDLDNFKMLNDTCGHDVGDQLLIEVAKRLLTCVRESDTIARLGGDEFVIMLQDLSSNPVEAAGQVKGVGEKILSTLSQPYTMAGRFHHSTPSIGATLFVDNSSSADELLKQADIAMYQAKTAGRNTLRFFNPDMQASLARRANIEAALRLSIQSGDFVLHYQAQVDEDGSTVGAEALLRWQRTKRDLILPGEFIPLAEETGQILRIGQWVLENACAQLAEWSRDPSRRSIYLAVNVSALQFRQENFVDQVNQMLTRFSAPAARLKLELTESLVLEDIEDSINKMRALKGLGVGFALDDFGTGYSSLSYLTRLPLDQLKIDRSFIRNLPECQNDAMVVQTIISLADSLDIDVVAEGVETEEQHLFLLQHGCPKHQGYLFGKPVEQTAFEALLDS
jgi:diguanylate cyclase (GGDEF)-like protein/PAS domain S-box-containing protein